MLSPHPDPANVCQNQTQQGSAIWTEWLTPAPTFDENLATIESNLDLSFPDHQTLSTSSPPPSPPFLPFGASTSSATDPSTWATSPSRDNTKIRCRQCDTEFTGPYRKGNHARHVRLMHADKKGVYVCKAEGCSRQFARTDARLKHARKHHPGLHPGPVHRRRGQYSSTTSVTESTDTPETNFVGHQFQGGPQFQQYAELPTIPYPQTTTISHPEPPTIPYPEPQQTWVPTQPVLSQWSHGQSHVSGVERSSTTSTWDSSTVASSLLYDVGQWSSTPSQTCMSAGASTHQAHTKMDLQLTSSVAILELPRAARIVFSTLQARVDAVTYDKICDNAFFRWEDDARRIRVKQ